MKDNKKAEAFREEGNALFMQGKFYEALISYNKSLCYSLVDSENSRNLALAYANRSAVYLELEQFDKCLNNIQLARDNCYKDEKKLKEREEKCLKLKEEQRQEDPENDPGSFFKLSYPACETIPFIANCLEERCNKKFGRYIITNRDLQPGDIVAIEEPVFKTIAKEACYSRCTYCMKSNMLNLVPCRKCASSKRVL
jgi:tetratricopeptide (TPR) repeat protein